MATQLIQFTDKGLYCAAGGFYIDPWKPVDRAVITHAHSDHARPGSGSYLCHSYTRPLLALRLGDHNYQTLEWNEPITINDVKLSLHPAGHMIGSSQIRIEAKGEVWVVSGDYKVENDGISGEFEPVPCDVFITESTFGLPVYNWKPQEEIYENIRQWILRNHAAGNTSVLLAYSMGKAQRVLQCVASLNIPIFLHGAVYNVQHTLQEAGWKVTPATRAGGGAGKGSIVIAPGIADGTPWMKQFHPYKIGICSGWMQVRGHFRRSNADAGFALSDHADWNGLLKAVKATGARKVYVTHGFQSAFSRYLNEIGIESAEVATAYGQDEETETVAAS